MNRCPQCFADMDGSQSCPKCDFTPNAKAKGASPDWWRCSDTDRAGNRCAKPGALSESTRGGDRWFCHQHFPPFRSRGYVRTPPPQGLFGRKTARLAASVAEDLLERQAIQNEGTP